MSDIEFMEESPGRREALRWLVCFAAVVLIHSGAAWALLAQHDEGDQAAASAVMIDFVSIPVPDAPARDVAPGMIEQTQSDAAMEVKSERPDEPPQDEPLTDAEPVRAAEIKPSKAQPNEVTEARPVEPTQPQPKAAEPQSVPPLASVPDADAVLQTTAPALPPKSADEAEHKPEKRAKRTPPPVAPSAAVAVTTAPTSASARNAALISWKTRLATHLQRYKRYPPAARAHRQQGTATARFTVDRNGRVITATLLRHTGSPLLDEEALAMLQRSQPLPRPPSSVSGNEFSFSVPIEFSIR